MAAGIAIRAVLAVLISCRTLAACAQQLREADDSVRLVSFDAALSEELPSATAIISDVPPATVHLSLEEAKQRALASSVDMDLASLQVSAKCHALQAARKDFLPKLANSFVYFHFDRDLGTVISTPGILNPAMQIAVPVFNQDSTIYTAAAVQPITPLLKVREAVNITAADVGAAEAQRNFARREISKGVEQLYLGLLATGRIKSGLEQAVAGAQQAADATRAPDAHISLVQAQQGLLSAEGQYVELVEQMNALVDLPPQTQLELDELPLPAIPFDSAETTADAAVASSPKIQEARRNVDKAEAALRLAHADYVPSVLAYGFYQNQNATPTIQEDFTGVGLSASYTLEWGKKHDNYRASMATVGLARHALRKEIQDTRLNAAKAFHTAHQTEQALDYATQLVKLNGQVQPPATDLAALKAVLQARLEGEVAAIKAELDYRTAIAELRSITGHIE